MFVQLITWAVGMSLWIAFPVAAQTTAPTSGTEVTSTGFYRDQDTLPGSYRLYQQQPKKLDWLWSTGPYQRGVRKTSFKQDAHSDVDNYSPRSLCTDCHRNHSRDMHMSRVGITCVQCHRDKPIAGVLSILLGDESDPAPCLCVRQMPRRSDTLIRHLRGA